jgi:hypothetical protein
VSATTPLRRAAAIPAPVRTRGNGRTHQGVRVARAPVTPSPRPRLVPVVPARPSAGRLPFLVLVGALMVVGLVSVLLLHTVAAQYAFRITAQQQRLASLTDEEQQEAQLVAADSSPVALHARAIALGMVPSALTHLRPRAGGRAVGRAVPVYAPPPPVPAMTSSKKSGTASSKAGTSKASTSAASGSGNAAKSASSTGRHAPTHHSPKPHGHHSGASAPATSTR